MASKDLTLNMSAGLAWWFSPAWWCFLLAIRLRIIGPDRALSLGGRILDRALIVRANGKKVRGRPRIHLSRRGA